MPTAEAQIELIGNRKEFGDVVAVAGLSVADGELFAILGPSGSGKTTILRLIAGFEQPTAGVLQQHAPFPHLTVAQNVEYGLPVRGVARAERRRPAGEALETVRLGGFELREQMQLELPVIQRAEASDALHHGAAVTLAWPDNAIGDLNPKT